MAQPCVIAIDGEAASGKSTVAGLLAERLGYLYLDTGSMYRAVTWAALNQGVAIENEAGVTQVAQRLNIRVTPEKADDGRQYTVYVDGRDVTWAIREPEVDADVSAVSAYLGVRQALTRQMRQIAAERCVIMVGRDIGTVVLPDADLKIYMWATLEERARRRWRESCRRGENADFQEVLDSMRRRDRIDSNRRHAPLRPADDAIHVQTDGVTAEQVAEQILALETNPRAAQG